MTRSHDPVSDRAVSDRAVPDRTVPQRDPGSRDMGRASRRALDCEILLTADDHAMLSVAGREFLGRPDLGESLRRELRRVALDLDAYGTQLFQGLFREGDELLAGYREALTLARNGGRVLRVRLHLSPVAPQPLHQLRWELLRDPREGRSLGRSHAVTLSRYLSVPLAPGTAVVERPRVLVVVAAPRNLEAYGLAAMDAGAIRQNVDHEPRAADTSSVVRDVRGPGDGRADS